MLRRKVPRERRAVAAWTRFFIWPVFRYSKGRDGYVLRVVGNGVGPVLVLSVPQGAGREEQSHAPTTQP